MKKQILSLFLITLMFTTVFAADEEYLTQRWVYESKAGVAYVEVADMDGDGGAEIAAGSAQMMMGGAAGWINILDKEKNCQGEYVLPGYLVAMTVDDLDSDGEDEVIAGVFSRLHVVDGNGVKKWDMTARYGYDISALSVADVNSDGKKEIILGAGSGSLHNELFVISSAGKIIWSVRANGEIQSILAEDLDGDGVNEIFAGTYGRQSTYTTKALMHVFNSSGDLRFNYATNRGVASIAVADTNGDDSKEILVGTYQDLFVLNEDGADLWQYATAGLIRAISVEDIDADGKKEIILGSNDVYALDAQGKLKWKHSVGPEVYSIEVIDLNKDGKYEVLASCSDGAYIIESDGSLLWQFKANTVKGLTAADLESDGYLEVVFGTGQKQVYVFQSETYAKQQEAYAKYKAAEASYNKKDFIAAIAQAQEAKSLYDDLDDSAGVKQAEALIDKIEGDSRRMNQEKTLADEYYNTSLQNYISGGYVEASKYAEKAKYKYIYLKDTQAIEKCEDIIDKSAQFIKYNSAEYLENATESYSSRRYEDAMIYAEKAYASYEYLEDDNKTFEAAEILAGSYYSLADLRARQKDFENASIYAQKSLYLYTCLGKGTTCDPAQASIKDIGEAVSSIADSDYSENTYGAELSDLRSLLERISREETGGLIDGLGRSIGSNILYIMVGFLVLVVFALLGGSLYIISKRQPKEKSSLQQLQPSRPEKPRKKEAGAAIDIVLDEPCAEKKRVEIPKVRRDKLRGDGLAIKKTMRGL